jgi:putative intracellular protease/amidase
LPSLNVTTGPWFVKCKSRFDRFAVRDGNLITGQQQYSGAAAAALVIEALGR